MSRVKIKQLGTVVTTVGLHFGGGAERRKLEPGEVVEIDDNLAFPDGTNVLDGVLAGDRAELTRDVATRPLDYVDAREAKLCSPTFRPRGPDEEIEMQRARAAVAARMESTSKAPPMADSPAEDKKPAVKAKKSTPKVKAKAKVEAEAPTGTVTNRRASRRAAVEAAQSGEANTT